MERKLKVKVIDHPNREKFEKKIAEWFESDEIEIVDFKFALSAKNCFYGMFFYREVVKKDSKDKDVSNDNKRRGTKSEGKKTTDNK